MEPEGGYLSCWDNETDIEDDSSSNLLFANINGDSASVICLNDDEAIELIQRWKAKEVKGNNSKLQQQESSSKPGSDGTYEIVDGEEVTGTNGEHIYESIEDCTPEYQLFISNENTSPLHTPTHVTTVLQRQISRNSTTSMKSKRSNSLPISSTSSPKFARKYSDCTEYSRLKRRQNLSMDAGSSSRQLPGLPPPLPPPNNTNGSVFTATSSSEYSQLYGRLNGKTSPDKDTSPPPSMVLKHKGKSYVLPITESGKSNKDKAKRQSSAICSTTPKHSLPSSNSPNHSSDNLRYAVPRSVSMGFQSTQSKSQSNGIDTTPRRKSKHSSSRSTPHHSAATGPSSSQSNKSQVTLYGVL